MLATLWFDKSHEQEIFSISSRVVEVDRRLMAIKPPSFIPRLQRSLSEISHYKAVELKNFLLFYSLPCLIGILFLVIGIRNIHFAAGYNYTSRCSAMQEDADGICVERPSPIW